MNTRNRFLTAILLILIGILAGGFLVLLEQGKLINDQSDVSFTEIKTSNKPAFSSEELEKIDARFLLKNVADQVLPTVVYINTVVAIDNEQDEDTGFWDRFRSRRARSVGSGVIISEDGYIVTNNHVIRGAVSDGISVIINDKRTYDARVVGTDPTTDLAIIKIDAENLPAIVIGNSDEVNVGEWVLAVGNPFRLRSTVTAGIVSALSRQVNISGERGDGLRIESFIQTDAAINRGNSGGALVNTGGELIGINTAIASESGNYQGYGFAVPSNLVRKVVRDLIEFGEVQRALLGVSIAGVSYERARQLGLDAVRGVEILELAEKGAAKRYGLQARDVILEVNDVPVNEANELQERIAVLHPGDTANITIWRDGSEVEKEVVVGKAENGRSYSSREAEPDDEDRFHERQGMSFKSFALGFKIMALATPEDASVYDLIIAEVTAGSEAAKEGIQEGALIRAVNGTAVQSVDELERELDSVKEGAMVLLKVETSEGAMAYYQLKK